MLSESTAATPATLLALAARFPLDFPLLLDSADAGPLSRWTILAAFPEASIRLCGDGRLECREVTPGAGFLDTLERAWQRERMAAADPATRAAAELPPFRGGWVVFMAYELAREIETTLATVAPLPDATVALALRTRCAIACDRHRDCAYLVAEQGGAALLAALRERIAAVVPGKADRPVTAAVTVEEEDPALYLAAVRTAQRYIAAGDIYQANLSRGWQVRSAEPFDAAALYRSLRAANPAPFAAWLQHESLQLLCSSPERLVRTRGRHVDTRPIAGTRPRHAATSGADQEIAGLLASSKERAEHIMMIDLERNDLGRIAAPGSVHVDEWMVTESYAHVHHIVSNVTGLLRAETTPVQVLRAMFPGGTITGCPKFRCMQLIAELEATARGAYTGSLGYINCDGDMDFNILIRTLSIEAGQLGFRAGAGIVADSDAQHELGETRAKARGLLRALGVA